MTPRDLLLLLFLSPAAAQAQGDGASAPATTAPPTAVMQPAARPDAPRASALAGRQVVSDDGRSIGQIVDYALDDAGQAYALLDTDGADSGDLTMVPHGMLKFHPDSNALVYAGPLAALGRTPVATQ